MTAALTLAVRDLSLDPLPKQRQLLLDRDDGPNAYKALSHHIKEQIALLVPLPMKDMQTLIRYSVRVPSQPVQDTEKASSLFQKLIACEPLYQKVAQSIPLMPAHLITEYALSERSHSNTAIRPFLWILKAQTLAKINERESLAELPTSFRILSECILHATPRELAPLMEGLLQLSRKETPMGKAVSDFLVHVMKVDFPRMIRGFLEKFQHRKNSVTRTEIQDLESLLIVVTEAFFTTPDLLRSCFAGCGRNFRDQLSSFFSELYAFYHGEELRKTLTRLALRNPINERCGTFFHQIIDALCPCHFKQLIPASGLTDLRTLSEDTKEAIVSFLLLSHLEVVNLALFPNPERFQLILIRLRVVCSNAIPKEANQCTKEILRNERQQLVETALQILSRSPLTNYVQNIHFFLEAIFSKYDMRSDLVTYLALFFPGILLDEMQKHVVDLIEQHDAALENSTQLHQLYSQVVPLFDFLELAVKHCNSLLKIERSQSMPHKIKSLNINRIQQTIKLIELILIHFPKHPRRPKFLERMRRLLSKTDDNHIKGFLSRLLAQFPPHTN